MLVLTYRVSRRAYRVKERYHTRKCVELQIHDMHGFVSLGLPSGNGTNAIRDTK